jgi:hypothetical protein
MYFAIVAIDRPGVTDAGARTRPVLHAAARDSSLADGMARERGAFSEVLCSATTLQTMAGYNAGRPSLPE